MGIIKGDLRRGGGVIVLPGVLAVSGRATGAAGKVDTPQLLTVYHKVERLRSKMQLDICGANK